MLVSTPNAECKLNLWSNYQTCTDLSTIYLRLLLKRNANVWTIALTQINKQIRIIVATVLSRSYSKVNYPDILAETGSKMVTSQDVFINIESETAPIKTARTYFMSVSRGQWMEEPQPQSM